MGMSIDRSIFRHLKCVCFRPLFSLCSSYLGRRPFFSYCYLAIQTVYILFQESKIKNQINDILSFSFFLRLPHQVSPLTSQHHTSSHLISSYHLPSISLSIHPSIPSSRSVAFRPHRTAERDILSPFSGSANGPIYTENFVLLPSFSFPVGFVAQIDDVARQDGAGRSWLLFR